MSGALSLFRELYTLYRPNALSPTGLFWRFVWIAFILSSATAWIAEYRRAELAGNEVAGLKSRPVFTGHIYQFNIHPRTGITPPKMLQEALDIFADRRGAPKTELKVDCDVFIEALVVNEVSAVGTIVEYDLEVERDGQSIKLRSEPGFLGWNQMRTPYRIDPVTGEKVMDGVKCEEVPDLLDLTRRPMLQGHSVEGWLHFVFEQTNPLTLETNPIKLKKLTAIDSYGTRHDIAKGWIGERQTAIAPDVMPAYARLIFQIDPLAIPANL